MKKIIPLLIILFWIIMTSLFISRQTPNSDNDLKTKVLMPESKQRWMGIYMKGQKIGYTSYRLDREIEGYGVHEEIRMKIMVLGTMQDIHSKTDVSLTPDFKVLSFTFSLHAAQNIEVRGKLYDKTLSIDI